MQDIVAVGSVVDRRGSRPPPRLPAAAPQARPPQDPAAGPSILILGEMAEGGDPLAEYLRLNGLRATVAREASAATIAAQTAILLCPRALADDGLAMLRAIMALRAPPAVILYGGGGGEVDRIVAFELGAADCVAPPCSHRELLARLRSTLRHLARDPDQVEAADGPEPQRARFSGWTLDLLSRRLRDRQGRRVPLANFEHLLLLAFLRHPRTTLDRETLLALTDAGADGRRLRAVDVQVSRLRERLRLGDAEIIRTVRGKGYLFLPEISWE